MTKLNKWFFMINPGDTFNTYTCDSWIIPENGAEIWCTGWKRGQTIKPYGDGCHVYVGISVFHCDQLMEILTDRERDGESWGITGVSAGRRQQIDGQWVSVKI